MVQPGSYLPCCRDEMLMLKTSACRAQAAKGSEMYLVQRLSVGKKNEYLVLLFIVIRSYKRWAAQLQSKFLRQFTSKSGLQHLRPCYLAFMHGNRLQVVTLTRLD